MLFSTYIYLRSIQNSLMTILAGYQVSDRCLLGYLFFLRTVSAGIDPAIGLMLVVTPYSINLKMQISQIVDKLRSFNLNACNIPLDRYD